MKTRQLVDAKYLASANNQATTKKITMVSTARIIFAVVLLLTSELCVQSDSTCSVDTGEDAVRAELQRYMNEYGFVRPERSKVDPNRPWRFGAPNYDSADLLYFRGRTRNHTIGSAEYAVENLVKTWEMEASHLNFVDWRTVSHMAYEISANGAPPVVGSEAAETGNYNTLLRGIDQSLYEANHTFESSHLLFRDAFTSGFAWELVEVLVGPPRVLFSWRHWAVFDGSYRGRLGDGKTYEMYGMAAASVNDAGKITSIEVFYKPENFLKALQGDLDLDLLRRGASIFGNGIPIVSEYLGKVCPMAR